MKSTVLTIYRIQENCQPPGFISIYTSLHFAESNDESHLQIMNGVKMNFARIVPTKALINEMRNDTINDLKNILEEQNYRVVTAASDISLEEEHNFILKLS